MPSAIFVRSARASFFCSGWPVVTEVATPTDWPSGFYEVALEPVAGWPRGRVARDGSNLAFFVLHPAPGTAKRMLVTRSWVTAGSPPERRCLLRPRRCSRAQG